MSLNTEPSQPEEREANDLPPKSYADAAEPDGHTNGTDNDHRQQEPQEQPQEQQKPQKPHPAQLEIHLPDPGKSYADAAVQPNGASTPGEYVGAGLDTSPKTPTRGHRRVKSKSSPKRSPEKDNENHVVYEKVSDVDGKKHLTSVKPDDEFEKNLRLDKDEKPKEEDHKELTTGRQAGAGWEHSRIRWAPLNVPLQRRLQTASVLLHTLSIVGMLSIYFFLCSIPFLWPILFPYTIYVLFSNAGHSGTLVHRWEALRRMPLWSLYASYFPARLHRTQELPPTRKYLFGYHPHGIISHGAFAAFATEALGFAQLFPGITNTLLTLDSNFRIPLYRDYALRLGLGSVSRESCENLLSKGGPNGEGMGRAITIVIGGARESLDAAPGSMRLVLARRKGFIKLAIRTGADLVPVLCFGENELYDQVQPQQHPRIHRAQLLVKKLMGFTVPLFHARGVFNYDVGMMPYRRPLNVVVGRPVMVVRQDKPEQKYVDEVHATYVRELQRIWDDWKDTFAKDREGELEIAE
ncbi:uncharacterized protein K452DRAFT_250173 [Aplosporella prunicola CBS 121167]|uniref:diacylglycerol O-acyltransferase n=1 Tax=Aplosporella prunicola CBS 121167 TaxID=1176127 RepID=A0A6A6BH96_9PEZI|nr:uncharacterized protein K452DRAFT_250173 [Aplosporella prunicola CBS 121167]KAF2142247.1 hypothetical protein K452DRAFT_250173 [Aplosporella prunicola CBS 121167]